MSRPGEPLKAAGMGMVLTALDTWLLKGPFLGLWGILASVFLGALGWFAGTAIVHRCTVNLKGKAARRARLWSLVIVASLITLGLLLAPLALAAPAEPSIGAIALHLVFIFALATTIRALVYAATRGLDDGPP